MNIASRVNEIFRGHGIDSSAASLGARVIELLVLDPRTTPQGLAASLRQQSELILQESTDSIAATEIVEELVAALDLQPRLAATAGLAGGSRQSPREALVRLRKRFPWPMQPPTMARHESSHFTQSDTLELLEQAIDELQPGVIVEVGAWLGGSTRWLVNQFPETLISIDTWLGSVEHQAGTAWQEREADRAALLQRLFETFLVNCWDFRERLIALRTSSLDGFWQIASAGVSPDLILLDGAHDEYSVASELALAHELFPMARLIIDDYNRRQEWLGGLVHAVDQFAQCHGLTIVEAGETACMLVE